MWSSVNTNNVHNVVNTMVQGLQMTLIRLPMVAQWDADDNRNYDIKDFAIKSKNQGMEVMLSIANTNGLFRSNNDDHLDDAHWINKWAIWLTCPKGEENTGDCVGMPYMVV